MQVEKRQKEIENNLSGEALECFQNQCYKLRLNKELVDQRGDELMANMERINKMMKGKKLAFEQKFGKQD